MYATKEVSQRRKRETNLGQAELPQSSAQQVKIGTKGWTPKEKSTIHSMDSENHASYGNWAQGSNLCEIQVWAKSPNSLRITSSGQNSKFGSKPQTPTWKDLLTSSSSKEWKMGPRLELHESPSSSQIPNSPRVPCLGQNNKFGSKTLTSPRRIPLGQRSMEN